MGDITLLRAIHRQKGHKTMSETEGKLNRRSQIPLYHTKHSKRVKNKQKRSLTKKETILSFMYMDITGVLVG